VFTAQGMKSQGITTPLRRRQRIRASAPMQRRSLSETIGRYSRKNSSLSNPFPISVIWIMETDVSRFRSRSAVEAES
jgi:hypothetical protein